MSKGECWLALAEGVIVGTVTVMVPNPVPPGYPSSPKTGSFTQLAVKPAWRSTGLGAYLLEFAEQRITELGADEIVIDTSSLATVLVAWYEKRGYERIGTWSWEVTNYESLVLRKHL